MMEDGSRFNVQSSMFNLQCSMSITSLINIPIGLTFLKKRHRQRETPVGIGLADG
jgi:hypothetical protein